MLERNFIVGYASNLLKQMVRKNIKLWLFEIFNESPKHLFDVISVWTLWLHVGGVHSSHMNDLFCNSRTTWATEIMEKDETLA